MRKTFLVLSALSMIGNHFNMFTMQGITIFIAALLSLVIAHDDYIEDNYDIKEWLTFSAEYASIIFGFAILAGYYRMGHIEICLSMGIMHVSMPSLGIVLGETYKMYNPKKQKNEKAITITDCLGASIQGICWRKQLLRNFVHQRDWV